MSTPVFPSPRPSAPSSSPGPAPIPGVQAFAALSASIGALTSPQYPRPAGGHPSYQVGPANGNLAIPLPLLPTVFSTMPPRLTYNSRASINATHFGYGVSELYNASVTLISGTSAQIVDGTGAPFLFTDKDGSGRYQPPAGCRNSLKEEGGGGWTEIQPDGTQRRYNSAGIL